MTSTTELLRELLDENGIEWKSGRTNENNTSWDVGDLRVTAKELSDGTLLIQQYSRKHFTPEQAIAATLGSEREKRLEKLVRSLYADYYSEWPDRAEEAYAERMKELGIEVIDR